MMRDQQLSENSIASDNQALDLEWAYRNISGETFIALVRKALSERGAAIVYWQEEHRMARRDCAELMGNEHLANGTAEANIKRAEAAEARALSAESRLAAAEAALEAVLSWYPKVAQLLDAVKLDWSPDGSWSEWDQSVRDELTDIGATIANTLPAEKPGESETEGR